MSEILGWVTFAFLILFFTVAYFWNKSNKNCLPSEEKKLASRLLSEAFSREHKYIWKIIIGVVSIYGFLFILEKTFHLEKATKFMYVIVLLSMIRTFFRNQIIYRKANLSSKFINRDLALAIFVVFGFAVIFTSTLLT